MQVLAKLHTRRSPTAFPRWIWTSLLALLAVVVAGSWLLVVYYLNGQGMLNEIKLGVQSDRAGQMQTVNGVLTRSASLSEHVELMAVYATAEFFQLANRQSRDIAYDPANSTIFLINEDTHLDELPLEPTPVQLRVDGGDLIAPLTLEMVTYSIHHKVSVATFPKVEAASSVELVAPTMAHAGMEYGHDHGTVSMRWDLPIVYPAGALEAQTLPFGTMMAVALGLLATVLTPCLIQLVVFYLSTLTGMSAEKLEHSALEPQVRRRLLGRAFGFVLGYTLLFTSAGALAGYAGETLQSAWSGWTRPLAIGSGIIIVLMGLWMAVRARAPLVCRLPLVHKRPVKPETGKGGLWRSTLLGLTFAVGCSTCFGGALIATLLLYVGTLGSAWEGALILLFFSLGVGIPFLISAALLTRVLPLVHRMQRAAPYIGLASSAVMVAFGVLLISDKFHLVSAWIYPVLGLK